MLFVFSYVDFFAFWRADVVNGALTGTVAGAGLEIGQTFLASTTPSILVPSLMVAESLLLAYRCNRLANLALAGISALTIVGAMVGETWAYYLIGSGSSGAPRSDSPRRAPMTLTRHESHCNNGGTSQHSSRSPPRPTDGRKCVPRQRTENAEGRPGRGSVSADSRSR